MALFPGDSMQVIRGTESHSDSGTSHFQKNISIRTKRFLMFEYALPGKGASLHGSRRNRTPRPASPRSNRSASTSTPSSVYTIPLFSLDSKSWKSVLEYQWDQKRHHSYGGLFIQQQRSHTVLLFLKVLKTGLPLPLSFRDLKMLRSLLV